PGQSAGHPVPAVSRLRVHHLVQPGLRQFLVETAGKIPGSRGSALYLPAENPDSPYGGHADNAGPGGSAAQRRHSAGHDATGRCQHHGARAGRTMMEFMPLLMFATVCLALLAGYPVAFTLGGVALMFAGLGVLLGVFNPADLNFLPARLFEGIMWNNTLLAVPLFVLMGVILEKSRVAENLLETMSRLFGRLPGGLGIAVTLVGMLLAASTGIVGATVVTMGLLALPTMLKRGYDPALATGSIAATGTLGQIIPPSIALVLLGDVLGNAYQ